MGSFCTTFNTLPALRKSMDFSLVPYPGGFVTWSGILYPPGRFCNTLDTRYPTRPSGRICTTLDTLPRTPYPKHNLGILHRFCSQGVDTRVLDSLLVWWSSSRERHTHTHFACSQDRCRCSNPGCTTTGTVWVGVQHHSHTHTRTHERQRRTQQWQKNKKTVDIGPRQRLSAAEMRSPR